MPDTIAAIATASAAAAVGIVRLSGAETRRVLAALFTPVDGRSAVELPPRRMTYGTVRDAEGRTLDHALAVVFSAGHSYTGEESAELHCHGSPVVLQEVLRAAFAAGARQARAGEFTERAFLNGKMDLTEAEAVIDLIDAETAEAARNAAAQVDGALRRPLEQVYDALLSLTSRFYAVVDYPDEDIEDLTLAETERTLTESEQTLAALLGTFARGRVLKSGAATAIVGAPNAGKSSLLNALFDLGLETGGLSRKTERGRHTTRRAEMMVVDGMFVLDTPGFSLLELENGIDPQDFAQLYPEYNALAGECRFQPCLHDREPGCAVHAAVDAGRLGAARWLRYRELLAQVRENWKGRYE